MSDPLTPRELSDAVLRAGGCVCALGTCMGAGVIDEAQLRAGLEVLEHAHKLLNSILAAKPLGGGKPQ